MSILHTLLLTLGDGDDDVILSCEGKQDVDCGAQQVLNTDDHKRKQTEICSSLSNEVKVFDSDCEITIHPKVPPVVSENAQSQLLQWAVDNQITHTAINSLLTILKLNYDASLPSEARTLLKTPVNQTSLITQKCGGQYYHFGLLKTIDKYETRHTSKESIQLLVHNGLSLKINCDGIPLHRSSRAQFWTILINFQCEGLKPNCSPEVVRIFYGMSKPNDVDEFLKDFIDELKLVSNGYKLGEHLIPVHTASFICDAPARQFFKRITSHNGYSGCERCQQVGEYEAGTVVFPELNSLPRSDENFLAQSDSNHHRGISPLAKLNMTNCLVSKFVLDPMHLVYLGVMRKLLNLWLKGPLNVRIGSHKKNLISKNLVNVAKFMPAEFNRKPRSLDELDRFKANESRSFLLYTGPVVLKDTTDINIYNNFMLLFSAVNLLSRKDIPNSVEYAKDYLLKFTEHFIQIYGKRYAVYNVRNLWHLPDDVAKHGTLDSFSAFEFENFLGVIKNLLRKPNFPLSQVINRISERNISMDVEEHIYPVLKKIHAQGPLVDEMVCQQYKELYLEKYCFKVTPADQGVMINNEIGCIQNIISNKCEPNNISIIYQVYQVKEIVFHYPLSSANLGIYKVKTLQKDLKISSYMAIQRKYLLIQLSQNSFAAFPLVHSLQPQ